MKLLNPRCSIIRFLRIFGGLCLLALSLCRTEAQPEFNAPNGAEFAYGDPARTMQITGIRSGQSSQDFVSTTWGAAMTMEAKPSQSSWFWVETGGAVSDFEASFDVKVTTYELKNPLSALFPGLPPLLGPWDGDGWAFVYGSPAQFDAWTKGGQMEDGNEMTLAAGMDMLRTDTLFIKENNGTATKKEHSVGSGTTYRATVKVSGNTFSFTIDGQTVTRTLTNYKPESGWVFAIGARNGAEYGKYEFSNWSLRGPIKAEPASLSMEVTSSDTSVFVVQNKQYKDKDTTASFQLVPQDKAEGGSSKIRVTFTSSDGSSRWREFTAILKPPPKPSINELRDIAHQEGVRTNRTYIVDITGISDGDERKERVISVTASSSKPQLVQNPIVNYASPAPNASLTLNLAPGPYPLGSAQPTAGGKEEAEITVYVKIGDLPSVSKTFKVTAYNAPVPTLDPIGSQTISEDAQAQTVTLFGINDGDALRDPELIIKAVSDNPILLPNPQIGYRYGDSTATLSFTPAYNQSGTAKVRVLVAPIAGTYPDHYTNAVVARDFTVTVSPVPDPVVAGAAGGLRFDGFDDRLEVPRLASLALSGEATIEFWQRATRSPRPGEFTFRLFPEGVSGTPEAVYSQIFVRSNLLEAATPGVNGKVQWSYGSVRTELDYKNLDGMLNEWTHWAFVVSTNDNAMRIFRNGLLQSEQAGAKPLGSPNYTVGSGAAAQAVSAPYKLVLGNFQGDLAEFQIWNVARSESEIRQSKDKPLTGTETGLMLYYRFLDGTGLIVTDHAVGETQAGAQPGTLVNGTSWVRASDLGLVNLTAGAMRYVQSISEGTKTNIVIFPAFDPDVPYGDELTFAANTNGLRGRLTGRSDGGVWSYTPADQFSGFETIRFTVTDQQGNSSSGQLQLVVMPRNDPPAISVISDQTLFEDGVLSVAFSVSDPDTPPETAKLTVLSTDRTVIRESGLALRQVGTNWTLTLRPVPEESGFTKIRMTAFDGLDTSTREFEVQVQPRPAFQVVDLGDVLGKSFTTAAAINDRGQVVGWAANDPSGSGLRGFFYNGLEDGGSMYLMPTFDATGGTGFSKAFGVNLNGEITGVASYGPSDGRVHAFRWKFGDEMMTDLGVVTGGQESEGRAINSAGDVAGASTTSGRSNPKAFWRSGANVAQNNLINPLGGSFNATNSASGINDAGLVVGTSYGTGGRRAFLLDTVNDTEPRPLGIIASAPDSVHTNTTANAVNSAGTIAGVYSRVKMPYGNVLDLNGVSGQLSSSGGPLDLTNQTFSVEFWLQRSGASGEETILTQGANLEIGFEADDQFYAFCGESVFVGPAMKDRDWHHWAVVFNGPAGERLIYLDGKLATRDTDIRNHLSTGFVALGTGVRGRFRGSLDDMRIWNSVRTAPEIRRGQYGWIGNNEASLLARWQFDANLDESIYTRGQSSVYTTDIFAPTGTAPAGRSSPNPFRISFEGVQLGSGSVAAVNSAVVGDRVYVAEGAAGIEVFERSTTGASRRLGSFDTAGTAVGVAATDTRLLVADGANGLVVLDVSQPGVPLWVGHYQSASGPVNSVSVSGSLAIITAGRNTEILDLNSLGTLRWTTNLVDITIPADSVVRLGSTNSLAPVLDNNTGTFVTNSFSALPESGLLLSIASRQPVKALRVVPAPAATGRGEIRGFRLLGSKTTNNADFAVLKDAELPLSSGGQASARIDAAIGYQYYKLVVTSLHTAPATQFGLAELELLTEQVVTLPAAPRLLAQIPVPDALVATGPSPTPTITLGPAPYADVIQPSDRVTASSTNSPAGEQAGNALDNDSATKYLNRDKLNSGFTVTSAEGLSVVTGLRLTSANDAPERDPASYVLSGSNDGVNFAVISSNTLPAFTARSQAQTVSFSNAAGFTSYRLVLPTVADAATACCLQIAEVEFLGLRLRATADVTQADDPVSPTSSNSPAAEAASKAIDNNPATKYLNLDKLTTGFTVKTRAGATVVSGLNFTSASDAPERDPSSYVLSGSNDGANFTRISSNAIPAFTARLQTRTVLFTNTVQYSFYRLLFPTVANAALANSMQIAEVEFLGVVLPQNLAYVAAGSNVVQVINLDTTRQAITMTSEPVQPVIVVAPRITQQPAAVTATAGGSATLRVNAAGDALQFQWLKGGQAIPGASGLTLTLVNLSPADAANYSVTISNAAGSVTSSSVALTVNPGAATGGLGGLDQLGQAVETRGSGFVTTSDFTLGGNANWTEQSQVTHDGISALSSSPIADNQESWMERVFTGPCYLTFWWKVSSQANADRLSWRLNGTERASISGSQDWVQVVELLPAGTNTVRWRYAKDGAGGAGDDRGYVDEVYFFAQVSRNVALNLPDGGTTGGSANWTSQSSVSRDGTAAASGAIGSSQESWMETTVKGPATVSFYWKVSSESGYDYLRFHVDGSQQNYISGELDWIQQEFTLGSGDHRLRWSYSKDSSVNAGSDRAWVDQVVVRGGGVSELAPGGFGWASDSSTSADGVSSLSAGGIADNQSRSMETIINGPALVAFSWRVSSEGNYDFLTAQLDEANLHRISGEVAWETKVLTVGPGAHTVRWTYSKDGSAAAGQDRAWVDNIIVMPASTAEFQIGRAWITGGGAAWVKTANSTYDGVDAAASGLVGDSQESWMETAVEGPGTLSFWWRVSSEGCCDFLRVLVNGSEQAAIGGNTSWAQKVLTLGAGRQTVRWRYSKDGSVASGDDRGYVDQVEFQSAGPVFSELPAGQSVGLGQNVTLRTAAKGASSFVLVRKELTWTQAKADAEALGGYLATISSDAEWQEVARQVAPATLATNVAWLGANRSSPTGAWNWVTGERFSYTRWAPGQPDGLGRSAGNIFGLAFDYNSRTGQWDDQPIAISAATQPAYLLERPATYQWKRDGVDLAGATNATLMLTNVTLAEAGAYTVVARGADGLTSVSPPAVLRFEVGSGGAAISTSTLAGGIEVRVFSDSRYVDTSAGASGELTNVWASLTSLGYRPVGFTGTAFGAARVVIVPKLERGTPSLTAAEKLAWANYVRLGGSIIAMHADAARWLNSFLNTSMSPVSASGSFTRGPGATATEFADDPASIPLVGSGQALSASSLPAGAQQVYVSGSSVAVATFLVDAGRVTYLGLEWSNMAPLGTQDGGWLEVLRSAIHEGARRRGDDRFVLAGVTAPGVIASGGTGTLRATVAALGPVNYQWLRDGVEIANATNSTYTVQGQTGATNRYSVRATSPAGPGAGERFTVGAPITGISQVAGRVYVAEGSVGIEIFDVSIAGFPRRVGSFDTPGEARSVDVAQVGTSLYAFVADGANGVQAWDVTNPAAPRFLASRDDGTAQTVTARGEQAFISDPSGLQILQVRSVPAILQHPVAATRNWSQGVEFRVVAEGAQPLRYQWKKDGRTIPGANGPSYLVNAVQPQDAGWYQVEISNDYTVVEEDKALSNSAGLTVRALPRLDLSVPGATRRAVPTIPIRRAFLYYAAAGGELDDMGALEANGNSEALGLNDFGQVVGTAERTGALRATLVTGGEVFDLNDTLPEETGWVLERANAINSRGEIIGVGRYNGQSRAFLLVPAATIGRKVVRPLGAAAGVQPVPEILRGNALNEHPTTFFHWSDATEKLYAVRPAIAKLSWSASSSAADTNRVFSIVAGVWPRQITKHIAGAPVEIEPRGVGFLYSFQEMHYPIGGAGVTLDTSAKTFNASTVAPPAGAGINNEVLRNQAYTVLRYIKNEGDEPDPKRHPPHFEVVRTFHHNDSRVRVSDVPWDIATTITYTNHTDYPGRNGYILFEKAFYDGAGPDRAYDRPTRAGPIIPVNTLTGGKVSVDPLIVVWYQMNSIGVAWAGEPRQYALRWPVGGKKIIIASLLGSGDLPGTRYSDKRVYIQPDPALPGFNLNEEHAIIADGKIWALRSDLNTEHLSEPFALLKYRNPFTQEWGMEAYQVLAEEDPYFFRYTGEAGKEIQAPLPLSVLPICADTMHLEGPGWEDYKGKIYARAAGPEGRATNIIVRYFYPVQAGFYMPAAADGARPTEGTCIPWLDRYAGTPSFPVDVHFRIIWPNAPTLEIGSTVTRSRAGLPDIFSMAKAQVIHDDLDPDLTGREGLARLYDPLSPRTIRLGKNERVPDELKRQNINGKEYFPDLPYVVRLRLSYDPINRWLTFQGHLDEAFGVGEPLLLPNILTERERDRIKELALSDRTWGGLIDRLYDLTRNPNEVDLDPKDGVPDRALRLGLTKSDSGEVIPEELGALPKGLTAGLGGLPPAPPRPGNAMLFDGENDAINVGNVELLSRSFTIEFWLQRLRLSGGFPRALIGQGGGGPQRNLYIGFDPGDRFVFSFGGVTNEFRLMTPGTYTDTTDWHHWACTFDAASGVQRIFYDGIHQVAMTNLARPYLGGGPLYVGAGFYAGNTLRDFFPGRMDEFRIWRGVALNRFSLELNSQKRLLGSESGLDVYYRFDSTSKPAGNEAVVGTAAFNDGQILGNAALIRSTAPVGIPPRFMTVAENNDPNLPGLPVGLKVIRVDDGPFRGDLKVLPSDNIFDERLTLRHSSDFGGDPGRLKFEWYYHPADEGGKKPDLPITDPTGQITDLKGWVRYGVEPPTGDGVNDITLGEGRESSLITLSDNYFICRFSGYAVGTRPIDAWSEWVGDPASAGQTLPALAEGWIKRVIRGLNPFDARTADFRSSEVNTFASMLVQAGTRYEGDIAFNPSADNVNRIGLIEAYETVLRRGRSLSIDGIPAVNFSPANNALLLAATKISDLYMLLGNESYADAQDPTIGFSTGGATVNAAQGSIYGSLASSIFCFQNQLDSMIEEELVLLRGRDDTAAGVGARPVYNRLFWNFTLGDGEVAYQQNYNISDQNSDGFIDDKDGRILFPQGHGDAWGHYLSAIKSQYQLLQHTNFTWIPRTEAVLVGGAAVEVDFQDERKFARTASQKAKTGAEIVDLTYRLSYVDDPNGQWQGYQDRNKERAWGVTEWARRAAQGAYYDWVTANTILPSQDIDPTHAGIRKVDRTTVTELAEIVAQRDEIQRRMDEADTGLNPLGLAKGAVPFDLDPSEVAAGKTHFEQVATRAEKALRNAVLVWDEVNKASELLRRNQDSVERFQANTKDQERDYKNRLIEIFGYPYAGDVGPGKTYASGYDGPDLYHYMYVNTTDVNGENAPPAESITAYYSALIQGLGVGGMTFPEDAPQGSDGVNVANLEGGQLAVDYPRVEGDYAFTAPPEWGQRRAPGEIQMSLSDMVQAQTRLKQMIRQYDNLLREVQVRLDDSEIQLTAAEFSADRVKIVRNRNTEVRSLSETIYDRQREIMGLRTAAELTSGLADATAEAFPKVVGLASDVTSAGRAAALFIGRAAANILQVAANAQELKVAGLEKDKETAANQAELDLALVDEKEAIFEAGEEAAEKMRQISKMLREEAPLRLEVYNQKEVFNQTIGRFQTAVAKGQRLIEERVGFRKNAASATTQSRYQDMTFRIFRNDALQKYRAQFDLAARYVFLAATAYDYEVNLLGSDTRGGQAFLTDIIRQRSLGQVVNGVPQTGQPGLADPMARLNQNFDVLKTQMGFNNPEAERSRFSLRKELFRLRDSSDDAWRRELQRHVVDNLWNLPEFRRFCRPFAAESAGAQPALVIRFPTTVTSALNFFGWPLGGGDSAYDASRFATKIRSVGVWFSKYDGNGLSYTPRIYLVPVGMDVLRPPSGNSFATREWRVVDQALPVPFQLGASVVRQADYIPNLSSLGGTFAEIRRFASFRAYHDAGDFDPSQVTSDSRLIGRSVWNTDWVLIIPGATFLADADGGLDLFINSVSDIKLYFQTYSYAGN